MRRWRQLGAVGAVAFASIVANAAAADATMTGPCTATVNGVDVASRSASSPDDAIDVGDVDEVVVEARASSPIGSYKVQMEFMGIRWTVAKGNTDDTTWTKSVKVDDYARYGAGIYRVHGVSDGVVCDGAVLVDVGGSPLTTPVGIVAAALVLVGVANAALSVRGGQKAA